jgi:hypothetical protein
MRLERDEVREIGVRLEREEIREEERLERERIV